jgi:5-methyltetrahydropteroyltriglutamate--homocysteine methyltransferase
MLFPTSLVGSYPQPDWLIDRDRLSHRLPPRVRAAELWRVDPSHLEQAQRDATLLALRDEERAGLDIVTDGEQVRESYSNRFATALDGVDLDHPATLLSRAGTPNLVPRITGPIQRRHPVEVDDVAFLRANTDRTVKMTVPGPFTMSQQAENDYYTSPEDLALAYAEVVNAEVADLFAAGADVVQLDEPWLQAKPEEARKYGVKAINRALDGITGTTAVHLCFGYAAMVADRPEGYSFLPELAACDCDQVSIETAQANLDTKVLTALDGKTIILGVLNLGDETVETPDVVADPGSGLRHEVPAAGVGLRQADVDDGGRGPAPPGGLTRQLYQSGPSPLRLSKRHGEGNQPWTRHPAGRPAVPLTGPSAVPAAGSGRRPTAWGHCRAWPAGSTPRPDGSSGSPAAATSPPR